MPTLREIFGRSVTDEENNLIIVRDRKSKQCTFIAPIDEAPFIRRCTKSKIHYTELCREHVITVNYLDPRGIERTAFFNDREQAERFKTTGVNWLECNYV